MSGIMAGGWATDGAVQEQIDATVEDAIKRARANLNKGPSLRFCSECDEPIPEARRKAVAGVRYCLLCQEHADAKGQSAALNRRGSKDSQLR